MLTQENKTFLIVSLGYDIGEELANIESTNSINVKINNILHALKLS